MYITWYGVGRAFIEGLRVDSLYIGPFRVSQLLAAVSCIAAVALLVWLHFKPHSPEDLLVNQLARAQADAQEETQEEVQEEN